MKNNSLEPKVVLGVCAHPDDLEFGAGASMAKWVKQGAKAYYLVCTDGSKGSDDTTITNTELIKTRRQEQQAAAKILGLKDVFFLDYEDGTLECSHDLKREVARVIRQVKPDVVVTMDPALVYSVEYGMINHTDHRAAGQAALDAVYPLARDHLSMPELYAEGLKPHKAKHLLMINFASTNYYEDIGPYFGTKVKALGAHVSQLPDPQAAEQIVAKMAQQAGKQAGCEAAEGFVRLDLPD